MILVVGATGALRREVSRQLLAAGHSVRVVVRRQEQAADLQRQGIEVVLGDLIDPASLARACQGIDAALASAHALMGTGQHSSDAVDDADSARANGPPPPIRDALPTAQPIVSSTLLSNSPAETAMHHLAADLDGAIARQTGLPEDRALKILAKYNMQLTRLSETPSASGTPLVGLLERVGA